MREGLDGSLQGLALLGTSCLHPFAMVEIATDGDNQMRKEYQITSIAQQIGHNLGAEIDDPNDPGGPFIMHKGDLVRLKNKGFSKPSKKAIENYLKPNIHRDCVTKDTTMLGKTDASAETHTVVKHSTALENNNISGHCKVAV